MATTAGDIAVVTLVQILACCILLDIVQLASYSSCGVGNARR